MTKTRSCDNLLNEGEKRTTQRRCSDPSLAPDVMKLSMVVNGNANGDRRECRGLTDSCVDELPSHPPLLANTALPSLAPTISTNSTLPDTPTLALHPADHDQVDGLVEHFESGHHRDLASNSSSLERELTAPVAVTAACGVAALPALPALPNLPNLPASPDEPAVFLGDAYTDVIGMADAAREVGRTRNISITWRSISESSNQSSTGFDIPETSPQAGVAHEPSPVDNHNCTDGDVANHNVVSELTNHNRNGVTNGVATVNGLDDITNKFLEVDLNVVCGVSGVSRSVAECEGECEAEGDGVEEVSSSGASSESEGEGARASQLTLCPASPRRAACCACVRRTRHHHAHNNHNTATENNHAARNASAGDGADVNEAASAWWGNSDSSVNGTGGVKCVCGAGVRPNNDSVDGLPPVADPLQARLHQIILYQKKVVEELSGQLREAREALRRASPPAAPRHARPPAPPEHAQSAGNASTTAANSGSGSVNGSSSGSGSGSGSRSGSGSGSGSGSEVEVGEEARGVVWVPDSAAPRCQYCRNHFWLARRRHHCRRCGGIFCGSCSEMSAWGECGAVRVCRRCRALR